MAEAKKAGPKRKYTVAQKREALRALITSVIGKVQSRERWDTKETLRAQRRVLRIMLDREPTQEEYIEF